MADLPTVLGLMQANSLTQWMTHWDDRLTLLLGADWLTILGLMHANSLTQWRTYQLTLLSGGWEANTLVRWFSTHWLTVLGLTDQLIASQKHTDWLTLLSDGCQTDSDWMSQSRLIDCLRTCRQIHCLTGWLTGCPCCPGTNKLTYWLEWFRADLLTFLGLAS